jgi:voltage-gated potassium channel
MASTGQKIYNIIFEAETNKGKAFDVILLILILVSVVAVMLESVTSIHAKWGSELNYIEWGITILFSIEYIIRIVVCPRPVKYIFSFYGIIDLISILPFYAGLFIEGTQGLITIRAMRLLRVFRVLHLGPYQQAGNLILDSLKASRAKIFVFLFAVIMVVIFVGTLMYLIESEVNGFVNIPVSIYWAIVTLTTVGYGDISPATPIGQFLASFLMILGYAIIAVPTGIVTVEFARGKKTTNQCKVCGANGLSEDAKFCERCGNMLET